MIAPDPDRRPRGAWWSPNSHTTVTSSFVDPSGVEGGTDRTIGVRQLDQLCSLLAFHPAASQELGRESSPPSAHRRRTSLGANRRPPRIAGVVPSEVLAGDRHASSDTTDAVAPAGHRDRRALAGGSSRPADHDNTKLHRQPSLPTPLLALAVGSRRARLDDRHLRRSTREHSAIRSALLRSLPAKFTALLGHRRAPTPPPTTCVSRASRARRFAPLTSTCPQLATSTQRPLVP